MSEQKNKNVVDRKIDPFKTSSYDLPNWRKEIILNKGTYLDFDLVTVFYRSRNSIDYGLLRVQSLHVYISAC